MISPVLSLMIVPCSSIQPTSTSFSDIPSVSSTTSCPPRKSGSLMTSLPSVFCDESSHVLWPEDVQNPAFKTWYLVELLPDWLVIREPAHVVFVESYEDLLLARS